MRVGFLFNHYAVHQVPQAAPYAFELSRNYPDFEVVIACSSEQEMHTARTIGHALSRPPLSVQVIKACLVLPISRPIRLQGEV